MELINREHECLLFASRTQALRILLHVFLCKPEVLTFLDMEVDLRADVCYDTCGLEYNVRRVEGDQERRRPCAYPCNVLE